VLAMVESMARPPEGSYHGTAQVDGIREGIYLGGNIRWNIRFIHSSKDIRLDGSFVGSVECATDGRSEDGAIEGV
jgi:hypothetical protein